MGKKKAAINILQGTGTSHNYNEPHQGDDISFYTWSKNIIRYLKEIIYKIIKYIKGGKMTGTLADNGANDQGHSLNEDESVGLNNETILDGDHKIISNTINESELERSTSKKDGKNEEDITEGIKQVVQALFYTSKNGIQFLLNLKSDDKNKEVKKTQAKQQDVNYLRELNENEKFSKKIIEAKIIRNSYDLEGYNESAKYTPIYVIPAIDIPGSNIRLYMSGYLMDLSNKIYSLIVKDSVYEIKQDRMNNNIRQKIKEFNNYVIDMSVIHASEAILAVGCNYEGFLSEPWIRAICGIDKFYHTYNGEIILNTHKDSVDNYIREYQNRYNKKGEWIKNIFKLLDKNEKNIGEYFAQYYESQVLYIDKLAGSIEYAKKNIISKMNNCANELQEEMKEYNIKITEKYLFEEINNLIISLNQSKSIKLEIDYDQIDKLWDAFEARKFNNKGKELISIYHEGYKSAALNILHYAMRLNNERFEINKIRSLGEMNDRMEKMEEKMEEQREDIKKQRDTLNKNFSKLFAKMGIEDDAAEVNTNNNNNYTDKEEGKRGEILRDR